MCFVFRDRSSILLNAKSMPWVGSTGNLQKIKPIAPDGALRPGGLKRRNLGEITIMSRLPGFLCRLSLAIGVSLTCQGQSSAFSAEWLGLKGSIDKYPVTLFLDRQGGNVSGHYWYDRTGEPISVYGTLEKGVLTLEAYSRNEDDKGEVFRLTAAASGWTGTWEHRATGRKLNVTLSMRQDIPPMQTIRLEDSMPALKGKAEPMARFQATMAWPTGSNPREAFIRAQVLAAVRPQGPRSADPLSQARAARSAFFKEYADQLKGVKPAEILEMTQAYEWSRDLRVSPNSLTGDLLSMDCYMYQYTGGAHGLGASQYKVLDMAGLKVLGLDDMLTMEGIRTLPKLLEKHFRRTWRVKPGTKLEDAGLLVERIEAETYNFYLTGKAVIFSFAPYEIAPYAFGEVEIPIPFADLRPYLTPAFAYLAGTAAR